MKRDNWPVYGEGMRPAGKPDECFYCGAKLGAQHNPECVIRNRTVVVKLEIELVRQVPEHWDQHDIEFHMNESSWCSNNALREVAELYDRLDEARQGCSCNLVTATYVREATEEDEERQSLYVKHLPS